MGSRLWVTWGVALLLVLLSALLLWCSAQAKAAGEQVYLPLISNGEPPISATAWFMPTPLPAAPPPRSVGKANDND